MYYLSDDICLHNEVFDAKIMQIECRKPSLLELYAEMQLILCKDNANREENEMNSFISYPEMQLILYKDNANREENEMNLFISYPEMQLILYKCNIKTG